MGYYTKTIDVDVDFDINDLDDYDLIDELEDRGYRVYEKNSKDQQSLIDNLEADGYEIRKQGTTKKEIEVLLGNLYTLYNDKSLSSLFEKELKKYFREYLNVNII